MMRKLTWGLAVGCLCYMVAAQAADWPYFLGPTHNGMAPDTGLNKNWAAKPPKELWRVSLSDKGFAGPSVADGKVFIVDHKGADDIVRALSFSDGHQIWSYTYKDLDKFNYGFTQATPVYSDGLLYTDSRLGVIKCFTAADGKLVWSKSMTKDFHGKAPQWLYAESAFIDGNKLIICTGAKTGNVIALNKKTGATIWTGGSGDVAGYATAEKVTILGQPQYVICTGVSIIGVRASDGKLLWSIPWKNSCLVNASQPLVIGNSVFVTSDYGIGCAMYDITANGPVKRWANKHISAHFSSPLYYHGYIYSNSNPGNLVCMSPQTGKVMWSQKGFDKGGLIIVDNVILAMDGKNGYLVMVKPDPSGYHELGRIKPLGGQSWTAPVISNGRLLIRNLTAMVCLDMR